MALSRGGAEGRTAGPLGFGPHLRPLCGPPLQQQHDFWSSPVSVVAEQVQGALRGNAESRDHLRGGAGVPQGRERHLVPLDE